ncbi:hypothetical protein ACTNEO_00660 [Gracilibacillus sp. HCP3S3_G5_1]|uniref:hypothetical protein n=1 Tax=unclassified Gracilibacillus TaxID=2625209 RepID=UPI003F8B38F9
MGYIIPVENYQYQQYHNRVKQEKSDPFPIEKLYPIQLAMHDRKQQTKEETKKVKSDVQKQKKRKRKQVLEHESNVEQTIYAEVTGKGVNFEASV